MTSVGPSGEPPCRDQPAQPSIEQLRCVDRPIGAPWLKIHCPISRGPIAERSMPASNVVPAGTGRATCRAPPASEFAP